MAKLYDKVSASHLSPADTQAQLCAIESFLAGCQKPAVLDFGDQPIVLAPGQFQLEIRAGRVVIEAWNETRSLSRRILSIDSRKAGVLDCTVQRFGGATGPLTFLDLDRPQATPRAVKGLRQAFAEQFRRMLQRQFPGWEIKALTSAMDLRRSFSAAYPRAHIVRGTHHLSALACPSSEQEPEFLSSALLWFDHLYKQLDRAHSLKLALFLPEKSGNLTVHRLRWLTGRDLGTSLFRFNQHGMAGEVDPADLGNLDTRLTAHYAPRQLTPELTELLTRLSAARGVGCTSEIDGAISIRFRGLEFARIDRQTIRLGIDSPEVVNASDMARVEIFAAHLAALTPTRQHATPALPTFPERWLEGAVRLHPQVLDPELLSHPIHGQVLTFAGGERNLIDLLAITAAGRLTIVELKASEDIQLPMQGLDYWIRIRWHAERNELGPLFPGLINPRTPKLLLVAPALLFHPSNEILLRYFSPDIEVERIGVHSDWESALQVAFRLRGADLPISHQRKR